MKILTRVAGFLQTSYDFFDGLAWAAIGTYSRVYGLVIPPVIRKELVAIARAEDTSITQVLREMLRWLLKFYRLEFAGANIYVRDSQGGQQTLVFFQNHRRGVGTKNSNTNPAVFFGRVFVPDQLHQTLKEVAQSAGIEESALWRMVLKTGLVLWETQRTGGGIFYQESGQPLVAARLFAR